MNLSRGRRRLIRRYFHGIGFLNPSGFLLRVYHIFPESDERILNKALIMLKQITLLSGMMHNTSAVFFL